MPYTFESFDTEIVGGKLTLPRNLLKTDDGTIMVYPSPYMTVRISDRTHFESVLEATEKLPAKHRQMILRLIHSKAMTAESTTYAARLAVSLMKSLYRDKADFSNKETPIPVRVENCGDYVQITVIE